MSPLISNLFRRPSTSRILVLSITLPSSFVYTTTHLAMLEYICLARSVSHRPDSFPYTIPSLRHGLCGWLLTIYIFAHLPPADSLSPSYSRCMLSFLLSFASIFVVSHVLDVRNKIHVYAQNQSRKNGGFGRWQFEVTIDEMDCKGGSIGIGWDVARRGGFHRPGTAAAASLVTSLVTSPSFAAAAAHTDARLGGTSMTKNLGFTIPGSSQGATGEVGYHTAPTVASLSRLTLWIYVSCTFVHIRVSVSVSLSPTRCLCPAVTFVYLRLLLTYSS
jgi:hypothetical protein